MFINIEKITTVKVPGLWGMVWLSQYRQSLNYTRSIVYRGSDASLPSTHGQPISGVAREFQNR